MTPRLTGNRCACRTCGALFNSASAFDKHRTGTYDITQPHYGRRCLTEQEMLDKGMVVSAAGFWTGGAFPDAMRATHRSGEQV